MYELPKINFNRAKKRISRFFKNRIFWGTFCLAVSAAMIIFLAGLFAWHIFPEQTRSFLQELKISLPQVKSKINETPAGEYKSDISYEQAIIDAAKNVSPSVVSIVISKNVPVYEREFVNPFGENSPFDIQVPQYVQKGSKLQEVGAGSGFIVSADGLILTNKHVVSDKSAEYTVYTNEEKKYSAKVLALDPVQDLAVIKIQPGPALQAGLTAQSNIKSDGLGESSGIQIGQTVIAIGNALGQFSNTVSVGIVSGLGRTVSASDQKGTFSETLEGIIQTDAAINSGNSGGPLVNLKGEVVGINTAMAQGPQSIGFAIPINRAKKDIEQVTSSNKIIYPFLGVRYVLVSDAAKEKYNLSVDYGALVLEGENGEPAVVSGSAAEKAGIREKDVILEVNGEEIGKNVSMSSLIQKYNPGDKIALKILRDGKEINLDATLGERSS